MIIAKSITKNLDDGSEVYDIVLKDDQTGQYIVLDPENLDAATEILEVLECCLSVVVVN